MGYYWRSGGIYGGLVIGDTLLRSRIIEYCAGFDLRSPYRI